jgi:hypothetical protein
LLRVGVDPDESLVEGVGWRETVEQYRRLIEGILMPENRSSVR